MGVSSGANTAAARRLRERGMTVVTLWADCSDRYGSMGLASPESPEVRCPLRETCAARARELLRPGSATRASTASAHCRPG